MNNSWLKSFPKDILHIDKLKTKTQFIVSIKQIENIEIKNNYLIVNLYPLEELETESE